MATTLLDKHVLITGSGRGIGYSIATQFAIEGARLTLLDFNKENLSNTQKELSKISKHEVLAIDVDVSNQSKVLEAVAQAERSAPIDVLINNAGISIETPFLSITEKEWNDIIRINLTGMFHVTQAVLSGMVKREKGVIINMASKNGLDGELGYAHYNASKGGVIMLTKTLALEFAHLGIRVNAVCPGYIETPMSKEIDSPEFTTQFIDRYIPMNRAGNVSEIANIFLFLASDASSFINGQTIIADGGQLAGQKPFKDKLFSNFKS